MFASENEFYRTVTVGESSVGKTAILSRLFTGGFKPNEPATTGASFMVYRVYDKDPPITLQIWDTAGQEKFRSLGPLYYRSADVGIIVFSLTSKDSFNKLDEWIDSFLSIAGDDTILMIVANKSDLLDNYEISIENAENWAKENNYSLFVTSALTGFGIKELFDAIGTKILEKGKPPKTSANDFCSNTQEKETHFCC